MLISLAAQDPLVYTTDLIVTATKELLQKKALDTQNAMTQKQEFKSVGLFGFCALGHTFFKPLATTKLSPIKAYPLHDILKKLSIKDYHLERIVMQATVPLCVDYTWPKVVNLL